MAIERGHLSVFTKWMLWSDTPVRGQTSTLPNPYFYFLFCFLLSPKHTHNAITHTHTHILDYIVVMKSKSYKGSVMVGEH